MEESDQGPVGPEIDFCTLGMFIIDEIHYLPPTPPAYNIPGGSGTYAVLGARLFSPPPTSQTISWIVDQGSDFPESITTEIRSWNTTCVFRSGETRLTTHAWNGYDEHENRAFKYTTPKLRLGADSLTPELLFSKSFHLNCSPTRCVELVRTILHYRKSISPVHPKPLFIWEPVPDLMVPSELLNLTNALPYIDVCSPNHQELAALMGDPFHGLDPATNEILTVSVERACEQLMGSMPLSTFAVVVRCGEKGIYVGKNGGHTRRQGKKKRPVNYARGGLTMDMDMESLFAGLVSADGTVEFEQPFVDPGIDRWLPAYFGKESQDRVVDPTGGGNGFLGGLAVALARHKPLVEASAWGSVAASFCIEQVGVPVLSTDSEGHELWNGDSVSVRLQQYMGCIERPELMEQVSSGFGGMVLS
ncbi:pfkB family carbohydrate kinase-like protein [Calycina marina]|uniref:PfkB family carbohydrate kinase-like protein n=1 Tax=Calycina marina TaxID=1763456 RepID=A0A9P7Z3H3_9HELO|nr:pfkB family carbohydrate kinase-like protein [Calycina marina]